MGVEGQEAQAAPAGRAPKSAGYLANTLKHSSMYLAGIVLYRLASFVMLPVYTRVLTPEDYGILEILALSSDIISMLAGLGIGSAVTRYYYLYTEESDRARVVSTAALLLGAIFVVVAGIGVALSAQLAALLLGSADKAPLISLAVAGLALGMLIEVPLVVLRTKQKSQSVLLAGVIRLLLALSLNILFVVVLGMGVRGVLFSTILAAVLVGGVLTYRLFREHGVKLSRDIARQLMRYGAPLVVWNLSSFVLHFSDRYFLRTSTSLEIVGLYSLGYKLAMLVSMFVMTPFSDIWFPKAMEIVRKEGAAGTPILRGILSLYNLVLITTALGVALFTADAVRVLIGAEFQGASKPVPVLCLAMVFFGYRPMSQVGAMISEKTSAVALASALAAAAVLALNAVLVPRYGMMGAAYATLGAFMLEFFVMRALSERFFPLELSWWRQFAPLAIAMLVWLALTTVLPPGASLVLSISVKTGAMLLFAGLLVVTGVVSAEQRQQIVAALRDPVGAARALRAS